MALNLDAYNSEVKNWAKDIDGSIKAHGAAHGITHRSDSPSPSPSLNRFRNRFQLQNGAIVKISKTFPRSLIWTHKGAGKGRGGSVGSRWIDKYGASKKTDPKSFGKMGTDGRKAKPFINEALAGPTGIDHLATIVAEHLGDALVGSLFIK